MIIVYRNCCGCTNGMKYNGSFSSRSPSLPSINCWWNGDRNQEPMHADLTPPPGPLEDGPPEVSPTVYVSEFLSKCGGLGKFGVCGQNHGKQKHTNACIAFPPSPLSSCDNQEDHTSYRRTIKKSGSLEEFHSWHQSAGGEFQSISIYVYRILYTCMQLYDISQICFCT